MKKKFENLKKIYLYITLIFFCFFQSCQQETVDSNFGTMIDQTSGKEYKTVTIGNLTWLAEDYVFIDTTLTEYIYTNINQAKKHAPEGWELPNVNDWNNLLNKFNGEELELNGKSNLNLIYNENQRFFNYSDTYMVNQRYSYSNYPDDLLTEEVKIHLPVRARWKNPSDSILDVKLFKTIENNIKLGLSLYYKNEPSKVRYIKRK